MLGLSAAQANGVMNAKTEQALRRYQTRASLPVTGMLDSATLSLLRAQRDKQFSGNLRAPTADQSRTNAAATREPAPTPKAAGSAQPVAADPALAGLDPLAMRAPGSLPGTVSGGADSQGSPSQISFAAAGAGGASALFAWAAGAAGSAGEFWQAILGWVGIPVGSFALVWFVWPLVAPHGRADRLSRRAEPSFQPPSARGRDGRLALRADL